jgi:hypothetical protein
VSSALRSIHQQRVLASLFFIEKFEKRQSDAMRDAEFDAGAPMRFILHITFV